MLNLDFATIAFQIINFLVLAGLLYYFLFRPVMRRAQARAAEKERLAHETSQEREDATKLRVELEARLVRVEEETAALIARAQEQAEVERATLLQEAQVEVEHILAEAHAEAYRLRQQAVDDFHDELVDAILKISGSMIGHAAPPEVHDVLVQQLNERIWDLGRSEMERVETFRRSLGERTPTAHVTTALPLSPEQQGLLARTFTALADRHVNLELKADPALAAGIRVRLGDMVVENSIAGRLDELHEAVSQALKEYVANE